MLTPAQRKAIAIREYKLTDDEVMILNACFKHKTPAWVRHAKAGFNIYYSERDYFNEARKNWLIETEKDIERGFDALTPVTIDFMTYYVEFFK